MTIANVNMAGDPFSGAVPNNPIPGTQKFDNFSTIDWVEDVYRDNHLRLLNLLKQKKRQDQQKQLQIGGNDGLSTLPKLKHWNSRFQLTVNNVYYNAQGWCVLAIIGISIGLIAGFLNIITEWLSDIKTGHCSVGFYLNREFCCSGYSQDEICREWEPWANVALVDYLIYVVSSTLFAFIAAFLVYFFAPAAAGSGISEIKCIIAGFNLHGFLGAKTLAIKGLTLPLSIASGLSVGKEGPSVHYATCVGNVIALLFEKYRHHSSKLREILAACTAAGVAVAFGSPMGGVLFSLEEISSGFQLNTMWRSYFCALVATGALALVNPFRTGQLVLFSVCYNSEWYYFETVFFVIIGILGGLYGIFVAKWNFRAQAFRKRFLAKFAVEEATTLALITALICYFNGFLRIDMTESIQELFSECSDEDGICDPNKRTTLVFSLIFAIIVRTFLVIISYGCKVPAGIFVPSIAVGALFGRLVGTIAQILHSKFPDAAFFSQCPPEGDCIIPGTYAFLGGAAALSGIMNLTITVVVIMYEITGALSYILPTMIAVGVTKAVGEQWGKGGIADQAIVFNGFPFVDDKEELKHNVPVKEAMTSNLDVLMINTMTVGDIRAFLSVHLHPTLPIVDEENFLVGYVSGAELQSYLANLGDTEENSSDDRVVDFTGNTESSLNFSALIYSSPITVSPECLLDTVVDIFAKVGPRIIFIQQYGKLQGLLTRKDALRYIHRSEYLNSPKNTTAAEELDQKLWDMLVAVGKRLYGPFKSLRHVRR